MKKENIAGNDHPVHNLLGIGIEGETRSKLQTITTWSRITAIGGFVNMSLNLFSTVTTFTRLSYQMGDTWLILTQLVSLAISFFLNFFLWQFSKSLKSSLDNEDQESFIRAAMQLKAYMRMLGIFLIVSIGIGLVRSFFIMSFFPRW